MSLLNYSTTIQAAKTVGEIERCLVKHGAREILKNYDDDGQIAALSFIAKTSDRDIPFRLPINADAVLKVLYRQNIPARYKDKPQAIKVALITQSWLVASRGWVMSRGVAYSLCGWYGLHWLLVLYCQLQNTLAGGIKCVCLNLLPSGGASQ